MRLLHAVGLAAALLLVAAAGPLALDQAGGSLDGRPGVARDPFTGAYAFEGHEARFVFSREPALDPERDAVVLLALDVGYTQEEAGRLRSFVFAGGRVLLVGERGAGAELLDRLAVGLTLTRVPLYSPAFVDTPDRLIATSTGLLPELPPEVVLTRPVEVQGGEAILRAPQPSWADLNDNGRPDLDEPVVDAAVAARAAFGEGLVVVVGDRDLFEEGEAVVRRAFLDEVASGGRVVVLDEAHNSGADPLGVAPLLGGSLGLAAATAILITGAGLGALAVLRPRFARKQAQRARRRRATPREDVEREVLQELGS